MGLSFKIRKCCESSSLDANHLPQQTSTKNKVLLFCRAESSHSNSAILLIRETFPRVLMGLMHTLRFMHAPWCHFINPESPQLLLTSYRICQVAVDRTFLKYEIWSPAEYTSATRFLLDINGSIQTAELGALITSHINNYVLRGINSAHQSLGAWENFPAA